MAEMKGKKTQSEELTDAQLDEVAGGFRAEEHGAGSSYLQIDGIKGESSDSGHKDWIETTAPPK